MGEVLVKVSLATYALMKAKDLVFKYGLFSGKWAVNVKADFCGKCKRWGHSPQRCSFEARCKNRCADAHNGNCEGKKGCLNCGGRHLPWSFKCPTKTRFMEEAIKAVDTAADKLLSTASC